MGNPHNFLQDPAQIKDVESLKRVDEKGYLYQMDVSWDYYNIPKEIQMIFDAGCSAFACKNLDNEQILYRNYDYGHRINNDKNEKQTGLNVVLHCHNPKAKYKSLCVADAFWLDYRNGSYTEGKADDGKTDISFFCALPYLIMDGVNEAGLALSILALPLDTIWEEVAYEVYEEKCKEEKPDIVELKEPGEVPTQKTWARNGTVVVNKFDKKAWLAHQQMFETHKPNLPSVQHPILMRYMLDKCASVDEAVGLTNFFNLKATVPGSTYHILLTDKTGKTVLLEWLDEEMKVVDINHATNFFVSREDKLGAGFERDEVLQAGLHRFGKNGMREDLGTHVLALAAQTPDNKADTGKTQYSCIYNLAKGSCEIYSFGDFSTSWQFEIE